MNTCIQTFRTIPLLVGVTGHRDLRTEELFALQESISNILADLQRSFPATPIVVLSALAEGGDQLVAKAATLAGHRLAVPLPMPRELYESDFQTTSAKSDFESLLCSALGRIIMPPPANGGWAAASAPGPARDHQYALAGEWIAKRAHVLIAVWDGIDNDKVAGTSNVVKKRLSGTLFKTDSLLSDAPGQEVLHVLAGRISTSAACHPGRITEMRPPHGQLSWKTIAHEIDNYNRAHIDSATRLTAAASRSASCLLSHDLLPNPSGALFLLREYYSTADALAGFRQSTVGGTWIGLYLLGWLAVLSFELYTGPWPFKLTIATYFTLLVAVWAWYWRACRKRIYESYLDYRALSEALRVQFFWRLGGIPKNASDVFLLNQQSVLAWIRSAVSTITALADIARDPPNSPHLETIAVIRQAWVKDQLQYFKRAAMRDSHRLRRQRSTSTYLLLIGLTLTAIQAFLVPNSMLMLLMAMAPVSAAFLSSHAERLGLEEHKNQYSRMADIFSKADKALDRAVRDEDVGFAQDILIELGNESLDENADWVLLHRQRPLIVPAN